MRLGARALILADDPACVALFMSALQVARLSWISMAETVDDAMRHCEFGGHLLALVDRDLVGADGLDFVRAIRGDPDHPSHRMPVIMLSAQAGAMFERDAKVLGVSAYLEKPVPIATLSGCVAPVLDPDSGTMRS